MKKKKQVVFLFFFFFFFIVESYLSRVLYIKHKKKKQTLFILHPFFPLPSPLCICNDVGRTPYACIFHCSGNSQ